MVSRTMSHFKAMQVNLIVGERSEVGRRGAPKSDYQFKSNKIEQTIMASESDDKLFSSS